MNKRVQGSIVPSNISLRGAMTTVFRRKWLVIMTFITAFTAAGLFASLMPDKYESRMRILVRNMRTETPVSAGPEAPTDRNEVSESQIVSEIELLKGRDLLEQLVKQTNLVSNEIDAAQYDREVEKAVLKLEKDLQISPIKKANIIEINYASESPKKSALVLQQLSELYLNKHLQVHHPPGAYDFFKNQATAYEQELRASENRLSNFQQREDVVSIQQQKDLLLTKMVEANSKLKDLNGAINEGGNRIGELQKQLNRTDKRIVTQSKVLPNQFSAERLNTMLVEFRNRRIQLLAKFQPTDRVIKEVDEQIAATTEALKKAIDTTAVEQATDLNPLRGILESDLSRAQVEQEGRIALRANLDTQVKQYQDQLKKLERATTPHNDLTRKVKQAENNYQLYAKKEEESRINDALDKQKISNVSIAEAPTVPQTSNKSSRLMTLVLGSFLGLMIGCGAAYASELLRETFISPQELESFTGYPVLATLPLQKIQMNEFDADEKMPAAGEAEENFADLYEEYDETFVTHAFKDKTRYANRI